MKVAACALLALLACTATFQSASAADRRAPEFLNTEPMKKLDLPFSEAVRYDHVLYLSGMVGIEPGSTKLVAGGIEAETKQALENLSATLKRNGATLDDVFKCTVMLADIAEWSKMNAVYVTYFSKHKPARSAMGVAGLALGARVEIECMAAAGK